MKAPDPSDSAATPLAGLLLRLYWMAFGVMAALALGFGLWNRSSEIILWWSLGYWLSVGLIVAARYVDIRFYNGETTDFEPATMADWMHHTAALIPSALALWAAAIVMGG